MAKHGQWFGITDGGPPVAHTAQELSRLHDALDAVSKFGEEVQSKVWKAFPESMQMEYNYSRWQYEEPLATWPWHGREQPFGP